jgi:predicted membrane protein/uncharacterized membrane protein
MQKEKRKNPYLVGESAADKRETNWLAYAVIAGGVGLVLVNVFNVSFWTILALLMVGLGVYILMNPEKIRGGLQRDTLAAPLDEAESAVVNINLSLGESTVYALPNGSRDLIHADVSYVGDLVFDVYGQLEKHIVLKPNNSNQFLRWLNPEVWFSDHKLDWRVMLSPHIPMDLTIHNGVGESRLDLKNLMLSRLTLHNGVGESEVLLPKSDEGYYVSVRGGVGEIELELPERTNLDMDIKGGVGEVKLTAPKDTGIQLWGKEGIGDINVSSRFEKLKGQDDDEGRECWQTKGYDRAEYQIVIHYDGGIGELKVR